MSLAAVLKESGPGSASLLEVTQVRGASTVTRMRSVSPLRLLVPQSRGISAWAMLGALGGGVVAGDQTRIQVRVDDNARLFLGSQSSGKIYKADHRPAASHRCEASVGRNAILVVAPDIVQSFAGSSYSQSQDFHLAPDSGLLVLDWFCSGRIARGESWRFSLLETRNRVWVGDQCVLVDALRLSTSAGQIELARRFGRHHVSGTMTLIGPPMDLVIDHLRARWEGLPQGPLGALAWSLSECDHGAMVRFAAVTWEEASLWIQALLEQVTPLLGANPWSRRN